MAALVLGLVASAANADITTGLVAHYAFDGDLTDDGSVGVDGAKGGAGSATYVTGSKWAPGNDSSNKAISLDGVDDYIRFQEAGTLDNENVIAYTDMTVAMWAYFNTEPLHGQALYRSSLSGAWEMGGVHTLVQNVGGRETAYYPGPWTYITGASGMQPWSPTSPWNDPEFKYHATNGMFGGSGDGKWIHVALTWDAGQSASNVAKLYINGMLKMQGSPSQAFDQGFTLTQATLGAMDWNGTMADFTNAYFDDLRIYNRTLSLTDIQELPEPATIALLGMGSLALLRRKKK